MAARTILFIHQNFPGQFIHLAPALVKAGHHVLAFTPTIKSVKHWAGVQVIPYPIQRGSTVGIHPWVGDFETKTIRAEALYRKALELKSAGYVPDLVIAHPGWGESLFIKELWPETTLALYCEFYYQAKGADVDFDPEFISHGFDSACRLRLKNVNNLVHMSLADAGLSPTYWQASTFPDYFRQKISVVHDGIDTGVVKPNAESYYPINETLTLSKQDEVITFINRNLEPYRGYHSFMRSLPALLAQRPKAHVLLIGGFEVSYGSAAPEGQSWYQLFLDEVKDQIDLKRVHFLGKVPYGDYLKILQLSTVHVYLTYPFVLSWSLLEAMSCECAIVASDTAPVAEVIKHEETGLLVDFFNYENITQQVIRLLEAPDLRQKLGQQARDLIQQQYDLKAVCLPRQLAWVQSLLVK